MAAHSIDVGTDNFREVVLEGSGKAPVVIDFWAPWCAPCRALKPVLEKLAQEYTGRFTLAKINSDENQEIAAHFGVRGIPAVKAVVNAQVVDEFVGALPESQVRAFIERILPSPSELVRLQARELFDASRFVDALPLLDSSLELDPKNEAAKQDRLEALIRLQRFDEARDALALLSPLSLDEPRISALKAELEFAGGANEDETTLTKRLDRDPNDLEARLQLARHHARNQAYEPALDQLLEIIRRDRKFGDDAGRKLMIEIFNLLGGQGELVGKYRRLLSSALY